MDIFTMHSLNLSFINNYLKNLLIPKSYIHYSIKEPRKQVKLLLDLLRMLSN